MVLTSHIMAELKGVTMADDAKDDKKIIKDEEKEVKYDEKTDLRADKAIYDTSSATSRTS